MVAKNLPYATQESYFILQRQYRLEGFSELVFISIVVEWHADLAVFLIIELQPFFFELGGDFGEKFLLP